MSDNILQKIVMKNYINYLKNRIKTSMLVNNKLQHNDSYTEVAKVLSLACSNEFMKGIGAFFTEQTLATEIVNGFKRAITIDSIVLDPTCGVGNLLIEASRKLGVTPSLYKTLKQWGQVLAGYDICEDFVEITKLRLVIEALSRGVTLDCSIQQALLLLNKIEVRNALEVTSDQLKEVSHLLMNPPFLSIESTQIHYWKKGKVNSAGIFFDLYLRILPDTCEIAAILPDILRSGSRYYAFRDFVSKKVSGYCRVWGKFSRTADVDVFILLGKITSLNPDIQWIEPVKNELTLGDKYDVLTGPLVAYRDPQEGGVYPYFYPKNCKNWEIITTAKEYRAFSGRVILPPCILIKRTSSPSDKFRAAATLVNLKQYIAVENHLIVVTPKNKSLINCKKLLRILSKEETNNFLNQRIRARHLTVEVIKSIPLLYESNTFD